ncbi:5-oxoprolinase subunit PxpA [Aeromicrobium duanguangcaii]|uniref:LamB/YcsF family protein n=1 Tax=Aeromicrobium duanguangcaii TaxID=2968086 RepID=A0ABY5KF56_9ACTN|nr:5-oxoprolinase subunit PxpA [Aeromicrobium duanguangcaii]MCD9153840.1 LamB/YcsF family protein [Aeromicrobium duanguangcaii]MCL3837565.1 LamB/YcsF family protein [Aeromicrobium duanguangcaii]UUI69079.1 LamB/YcsF family protein [Aeromicrobium duanguangcaii]
MPARVDLNVDLGESAERWASGEDRRLLALVTSANVCCGAYAGDDVLIAATCRAAVEHGVAIGAQVGYPDRDGFGRRAMELAPRDLADEVRRQVEHLRALADAAGGVVSYVKPHGALYHRISHDPTQAAAVVEALLADPLPLPLVGMPGSLALRLARDAGVGTVHEGFADRAYAGDGSLVPRGEAGAVLTDPDVAAQQALSLVDAVDSVCVHSDSPGAELLLGRVRDLMDRHAVHVRAFG